jgi:hypothetical protein
MGGAFFVVRFAEATVRDFVVALATARFGAVFLTAAFGALCARALPAGERLVAGFNLVDFALTTRLRLLAPREVSRFCVLLTGLLMPSTPHSYTKNLREPARSLTQLLL